MNFSNLLIEMIFFFINSKINTFIKMIYSYISSQSLYLQFLNSLNLMFKILIFFLMSSYFI